MAGSTTETCPPPGTRVEEYAETLRGRATSTWQHSKKAEPKAHEQRAEVVPSEVSARGVGISVEDIGEESLSMPVRLASRCLYEQNAGSSTP